MCLLVRFLKSVLIWTKCVVLGLDPVLDDSNWKRKLGDNQGNLNTDGYSMSQTCIDIEGRAHQLRKAGYKTASTGKSVGVNTHTYIPIVEKGLGVTYIAKVGPPISGRIRNFYFIFAFL